MSFECVDSTSNVENLFDSFLSSSHSLSSSLDSGSSNSVFSNKDFEHDDTSNVGDSSSYYSYISFFTEVTSFTCYACFAIRDFVSFHNYWHHDDDVFRVNIEVFCSMDFNSLVKSFEVSISEVSVSSFCSKSGIDSSTVESSHCTWLPRVVCRLWVVNDDFYLRSLLNSTSNTILRYHRNQSVFNERHNWVVNYLSAKHNICRTAPPWVHTCCQSDGCRPSVKDSASLRSFDFF